MLKCCSLIWFYQNQNVPTSPMTKAIPITIRPVQHGARLDSVESGFRNKSILLGQPECHQQPDWKMHAC